MRSIENDFKKNVKTNVLDVPTKIKVFKIVALPLHTFDSYPCEIANSYSLSKSNIYEQRARGKARIALNSVHSPFSE